MKKNYKNLLILGLLVAGLLASNWVLAQGFGTEAVNNGLAGSLSSTDPRELVGRIINIALGFLGVIAVGLIIYAGFIWMTSGGDEEKVTTAKNILKNSVIGLAIILSSWAIATFILSMLSGATNPGGGVCTDGDTRNCGSCGTMICSASSWGSCIGDINCTVIDPPKSCDGDLSSPSCQATEGICASKDYCDPTDCGCKPKGNLGDPCDLDTNNTTCEPSNNRCAQYLTCNPGTCTCFGPPIITGISPLGGFCANNVNKSCNDDSECPSSTCDIKTPNGTSNNFITIFGKNFGSYATTTSKIVFAGAGNVAVKNGDNYIATNRSCDMNTGAGTTASCSNAYWDYNVSVPQSDSYQFWIETTNSGGSPYGDLNAFMPASGGENSVCPDLGVQHHINIYLDGALQGSFCAQAVGPDKTRQLSTINMASVSVGLHTVRVAWDNDWTYDPDGDWNTWADNADSNLKIYRLGLVSTSAALGRQPKELNSDCIDSWSDNQIIIAVPNGLIAGTGQIAVVNKDNLTDATGDANGPSIPDFQGNTIVRPGLCKINPNEGALSMGVGYSGINLYTGEAFFGNYKNKVAALESDFSNSAGFNGTSTVPNIISGVSGSFVQTNIGGYKQSNYLLFTKKPEQNAGPFISSFTPTNGNIGQYVTIRGAGFGNTRGASKVFFDDVQANYDFPNICLNSVWKDNQIIVKVPTISTSAYKVIKIVLDKTTIDTQKLNPSTFWFDNDLGLNPSLCKIDPVNGPVGTPVSLWGEYFGTVGSNGLVKFNNDNNATGTIEKKDQANLIKTAVPTNSITGPVKVIKDSESGNELNFNVGSCVNNSDCGDTQVCCPQNTYMNGRCASELFKCLINIPTSVFEWSFSTGFATDTPETYLDSCGGLAKYYGACQAGASCPNVPGTCSPYGGGNPQAVGNCKNNCSDTPGCSLLSPNNCSYNSTLNKCIKNGSESSCDLAKILTYTINSVTASTTEICNADKHWEANISTSCPDNKLGSNWVKSSGNKCIDLNSTCSICSTDFSCQEISGNGRCVSAPICPAGSTCDISNKCVVLDKKICGCCCPISPDPVVQIKNDQQNCCSFKNKVTGQTGQLTCEGSCGAETGKPNPTLGKCGGCKNAGDTTEERDAACNCFGHGNQFCDVNNPLFTDGVCSDCSDLNVKQDCNDHSTVCCQDSKKTATTTDDICRGGNGEAITASTTLPSFGYCAYYDCSTANPTQCASTTPNVGQAGSYSSTSTCALGCVKEKSCTDLTSLIDCQTNSSCCFDSATMKCKSGSPITNFVVDSSHLVNQNGYCLPPAGLGLSCTSATSTACNSNLCVFDKASCLLDTGALSSGNLSDCGTCCCQPGATTTINNTVLTCLANKGNCTGGSRGLFCGCTKDEECGAATTGCGSDTCCKARPSIISTSPAHLDDKVCRNATIKVNFDQTMDAASFNNNVLLLEERNYADGVCPTGTFVAKGNSLVDLLAQKNKNWWQNLIDRLFFTLAKLRNNFFGSALAGVPDPTKLYCSTPGIVYGESNGGKTSLIFTPKKILNPATNYYLVVKGDESLNSKTGVLNLEEVGFNGLGYYDPATGAYVETPPIKFNNHQYINSQIIKFSTLSALGPMAGICAIDSVTINPSSYLFNTTSNALKLDEDDSDATTSNKTFDTVADSDKVFTATAYSSDKQTLQPVIGYAWNWDFSFNNSNVATTSSVANLPFNKVFVGAISGVTDGETKIKATVNMDGFTNIHKGGDKFNTAGDIYVFICSNPWPPVDSNNGTWFPWLDKAMTTPLVIGSYNYKFYYCRDSGGSGTLDDLPAINSTPVTMGTSSLVCSSDHSDCAVVGSPCGPFNSDGRQDGVCIWDVLKESYFLRAPILTGSIITSANPIAAGGAVKVTWSPSLSSDVYSYKVYYLPSGKNAMMSKEVKCTTSCSTDITGLTNNTSYIFQVSVISNNKAENSLSPEVSATPTDAARPATPVGLQAAIIGNSTLKFSWTANTDDTAFYRLYHGTASGKYGESFDSAPSSTSLSFPLDQFSSGDNYFALSALDSYKNESSNKSGELNYQNNIPNLVAIEGLNYYPLNTDHWWYQAPNLAAAIVNRECLVKLNVIITATSTTAICNNNYVTGTSTRWFTGLIKEEIARRYCSTVQCSDNIYPNSCSNPNNIWADRCYLHD